ncbi:MAG: porin family protein [Winogradskyella sp.]|uniref:hypothetical protein n=1 Tax=Winogradskyella sp. TaxID=1883156 RepID=UPI0025E59BA0|nr:hypothetical protein [Winogradskyella sp.]NRB59193.1 porin family protein [Winogradskyella sp.]
MRKLFLAIIAMTFITVGVNAQDSDNNGLEGAWWALGQLEYTDTEATDTQSFTILPVAGVFISPTVTIGAGVGYTSTTVGSADAVDAIILQPLARKYWSITDNFFFFGQADVPVLLFEEATGYGFNLRPGIDYFVTPKVTLEATFGQFGYNAVKPKEGDATGTTSFGFNSMNINFGIKIIL